MVVKEVISSAVVVVVTYPGRLWTRTLWIDYAVSQVFFEN